MTSKKQIITATFSKPHNPTRMSVVILPDGSIEVTVLRSKGSPRVTAVTDNCGTTYTRMKVARTPTGTKERWIGKL